MGGGAALHVAWGKSIAPMGRSYNAIPGPLGNALGLHESLVDLRRQFT